MMLQLPSRRLAVETPNPPHQFRIRDALARHINLLRAQQQMHMIVHQAVGQDLHPTHLLQPPHDLVKLLLLLIPQPKLPIHNPGNHMKMSALGPEEFA